MQVKILVQGKNPLMKREEFLFELNHSGKATPTRAEILGAVAKNLKKKEDLVIVDKIFSQSGKTMSSAKVFVYSKKEDIPKDKLEKMKRRMSKKKAKPEAPTAVSTEKKEEAPKTEGKKEEPEKPEVKKEGASEPKKEGKPVEKLKEGKK